MRLAPGREVIPIGTVGPNGVFGLGLLDKLGSPVCDFRQWAEFGIRGSVGKDEVGGHQGKTAEPRYTSIIRGQDLICQVAIAKSSTWGFRREFQLWVAPPEWTARLPTDNCQRRYTVP